MPREHPLSWHRLAPLALVAVLAVLAAAAVAGPKWYQRMYYPFRFGAEIGRVALAERVDPYLVTAVVHAESGFDPDIVSKKGAVGLMQVMPETAEDIERARGRKVAVTTQRLRQPEENIRYGARYLRQLLDRYGGDRALALAAYNAGIVNADRWKRAGGGGRIDFPQTRHYVEKVLAERDTYRKLYPGAYPWQKQ
ncbi:MAG TPA: lytic transglycosylase domain-containing protein [Coriobacteriia bacterium]|jgi:soluble lytic murein transglycosylase